jgi:hypothetical protein
MGCVLIRHGGKHDWYQNPRTKASQPIPRHKEIKDRGSLSTSSRCFVTMHEANAQPAACPHDAGPALQLRSFVACLMLTAQR